MANNPPPGLSFGKVARLLEATGKGDLLAYWPVKLETGLPIIALIG